MQSMARLQYLRRIASAYLLRSQSQLNFWHDSAELNTHCATNVLSQYYMNFSEKAGYSFLDDAGVPLLNYRGAIGVQYNPIAIAQFGLGNFNLFRTTGDAACRTKFLTAAEWLRRNLEINAHGIPVWMHHFDWEYRDTLRAPWYSGLAQGQGISLLVRAHAETADRRFLLAAEQAFQSFLCDTDSGGIICIDPEGNMWFEEYLVSPPTHILNGFIWAAWGVFDYFLATAAGEAKKLFESAVETLRKSLPDYDLGFWSLYEQSGTRLPMIASPFYHRLHITQLQAMYRLTGEPIFSEYAERWQIYSRSRSNRTRALCYKGAFKLCYY